MKALPSGTKLMENLADKIKSGANTFLKAEYKKSVPIMLAVTLLLSVIFHPYNGAAYLIGLLMSAVSGLMGMRSSTVSGVKVTNTALNAVKAGLKQHEAEGRAGKVAISAGAVMGFGVKSTVLLGLLIVVSIGGQVMSFANPANMNTMTSFLPFLGIEFVMFPQMLSCFALGCSTVAIFMRLGGGIFTKGADMGADQVGKTEMNLPEDSPLNPAVIADCVGDNVGDVAGNGSDLNESTAGAIASAMVLAISMYIASLSSNNPISPKLLESLMLFPLTFAAVGLLACLLGVAFVLVRKKVTSVARDLNLSLWGSAAIISAGTLLLSYLFFGNQQDLSSLPFMFGWISPWIGAVVGIIAGVLMGIFAERYTSDKFKSTRNLAMSAEQGPALVVVDGISLGWLSVLPYGFVFALGIVIPGFISGIYGIAMAAVGMLSFVAATVTVDTYGPIADNAGGIAEMASLPERVRTITDNLDSLGNTTAAVGKGFAIGSGVLAALSMLTSFTQISGITSLDMTSFYVLGGAFVGVAIMGWLSGDMLRSVRKNAKEMVEEVRKQFPFIKSGERQPDSNRCIEVCTNQALGSMKKPVLVSLLTPVLGGLIGGPMFAGGTIVGTILAAFLIAIFTANSGGAWDNAKKYVKAEKEKLIADFSKLLGDPALAEQRYKEMHSAAVVGDTVGDGFKDVVGPCQDIDIKMMATVLMVFGPLFTQFNLLSLIL